MKMFAVTGAQLFAGVLVLPGLSLGAHPGFDPNSFSNATSTQVNAPKSSTAKPELPPGPISGKVVQTMDSGGYTYVLIDSNGDKIWAAISSTIVTVGQQVTVKPGTPMYNFTSKGLNRTFERIIFSEGIESKVIVKKPLSAKVTQGSSGAAVPFSKISVEKAAGPNSYRIATLFANQKLDGKKVTVRGKVVKVSSGILDRNWIHLQDGTGSSQKKNHNLVVTSKDLPDVGEVITISGTLIRNKDFGSGYKYDVIIEKASIIKEPVESKPAAP
jgi:hypothetical protein